VWGWIGWIDKYPIENRKDQTPAILSRRSTEMHSTVPRVIQGDSKRDLQWYSKYYCVVIVARY
jgi:hypothetical protein